MMKAHRTPIRVHTKNWKRTQSFLQNRMKWPSRLCNFTVMEICFSDLENGMKHLILTVHQENSENNSSMCGVRLKHRWI